MRYVPNNTVELPPSSDNPLLSITHSTPINFDGSSYKSTPIYEFSGNHNIIWVKASNIVKTSTFASSKISYTFSYYLIGEDRWFSQYHPEENLHSSSVEVYQISFSICPYGYFWFWDDGNIESFTSKVWTSYFF